MTDADPLTLERLRTRLQRRVNRALGTLAAILLLFMVVSTLVLVQLHSIVEQNKRTSQQNQVVLTRTIGAKDYEIFQLKGVQDEAVAAIEKLAKQVESLGGKPGDIVLTPPTTTVPK